MCRHVSSGEHRSMANFATFLRIGTKHRIEIFRIESLKELLYERPSNLSSFNGIDGWSRITDGDWVDIDVAKLAREKIHYLCYHSPFPSIVLPGTPRSLYQAAQGMVAPPLRSLQLISSHVSPCVNLWLNYKMKSPESIYPCRNTLPVHPPKNALIPT